MLTRILRHPPARVFAAWTRADEIERWLTPGPGYRLEAHVDCRAGGELHFAFSDPDGTKNRVTGRYLVVRPPERLVFTWQWRTSEPPVGGAPRVVPVDAVGVETLVTVDFTSHTGGGTLLTVAHERFKTESETQRHCAGWTGALDQLPGFLDIAPADNPPDKESNVPLRLKYVVGSPNCRKVHAVIHHLDADVQLDYLDFFAGDLREARYTALNPNAMVPTLIDGDFTLWESNAINLYLASRQPTSLHPADPRTRADIMRWLCWELAHYNRALGALSFETVAKPSFFNMPTDAAAVELARRDLERFAPVLERHLCDRKHMVGDGMTLADYAIGHLQGFKDMVPFDWSRFPAINAFYERLADDPHWAATAAHDPAAIGRRPSRAENA